MHKDIEREKNIIVVVYKLEINNNNNIDSTCMHACIRVASKGGQDYFFSFYYVFCFVVVFVMQQAHFLQNMQELQFFFMYACI